MYSKMEKKIQKIFGKNCRIAFVRFFESKKNQVALIKIRDRLQSCAETSRSATLKPVPQVKRQGSGEGVPVKQAAKIANSVIIMKFYVWGERRKEEKILKKLSKCGIAVPKVIKSKNDVLFMEYIKGEDLRTLFRKLQNPYTKKARQFDRLLAEWLGNFHKIFKNNAGAGRPSTSLRASGLSLLKGDMRLQNFILHSSFPLPLRGRISTLPLPLRGRINEVGILYGVDFEESRIGAPEKDIAELFAVFLTQIIRIGKKTTKNDIKKYQTRTANFIKIYSKISGMQPKKKKINELVKQNLLKIAQYMPHLAAILPKDANILL